MSLNTNKAILPTLPFNSSVLIPPTLFGGKDQIGLSFWIRFSKRLNNYVFLFGSSEDYSNHTYLFDLKYSFTNRFSFRVALMGLDGKRVYANLSFPGAPPYPSDDTWVHLWITYDSTLLTSQLKAYINGNLAGNITTQQLKLWTNPTQINLKLFGNTNGAEITDIGEIAVYNTLPNLTSIVDYTNGKPLPDGAVLNYKNISESNITVIPPQILPEINGYNLKCTSGQGILTLEKSIKTPSIILKLDKVKITSSGASIHTEWSTLNGGIVKDLIKNDNLNPSCFIKRENSTQFEPEAIILHRVVKNDIIKWAIPKEARPTSNKDILFVHFPVGLLTTPDLQFSEGMIISPPNTYGEISYKLPPKPRCKIITNGGGNASYFTPQYSFNNQALTCGPWYSNITLDDRGIPIKTSIPNSRALSYIYSWDTDSPKGETYILWQGTSTSNVTFAQNAKLLQDKHIISFNGQEWYKRIYDITGPNPLLYVTSDLNSQTGLTDLLVIRAEHWNDFIAGKIYTRQLLNSYKLFDGIRHMDEFKTAINCNAWNINHIIDENYSTCNRTFETKASIVSIVPTIDPDGYFSSDTLVIKVETDKPHGLVSGQRVNFRNSPATIRRPNGTISSLNSYTCNIRTNIAGYSDNQVEVRIGTAGTINNISGGEIFATIGSLPNPKNIIAFHNELYNKYGRCKIAWINLPHAFNDELGSKYITDLNKDLHPDIELVVEPTNESWNWAFEGQWRYYLGEGKLLGLTIDQFHAKQVYRIYKLMNKLITSGRKFSVICAGQSINPSVLNLRMEALQKELINDIDPDKPSWENFPVIMSISSYIDLISPSPINAVNRAGIIALGAHGTAELGKLGFRDHAGYKPLLTKYNKPIICYEGGPAYDTPSNDPELTRTVFAASLHYESALVMWEFYNQLQEIGYEGVCTLPVNTVWNFNTGKNWGLCYRYNQQAGLGNGLDGQYDNTGNPSGNLDSFIKDGIIGWKDFCSTRLYAIEAWQNAEMIKINKIDKLGDYSIIYE